MDSYKFHRELTPILKEQDRSIVELVILSGPKIAAEKLNLTEGFIRHRFFRSAESIRLAAIGHREYITYVIAIDDATNLHFRL